MQRNINHLSAVLKNQNKGNYNGVTTPRSQYPVMAHAQTDFPVRKGFQKNNYKLGLLAQPPLTPTYLRNLGPLYRCNCFSV